MQKLLVLIPVVMLLFCNVLFAQVDNADSLALVAKIEADQVKLNDLQVQLEQRMKSKQEAMEKAQRSANVNASAADKLSNNPKHKRLAKKADKKASEARKDAKDARIETDKVEKLNKKIRSTKKRIAKNKNRLEKIKNRTPLGAKY
jgi:hypothetical protein